MLPDAPHYRIITTTQSAKKNENYLDTKWGTKPIKGSAVTGGASATLTRRGPFAFTWHLWATGHLPGDNFFYVVSEISTSIYRTSYTCTTTINTRGIHVAFPGTGVGSITRRNIILSATSWGKLWISTASIVGPLTVGFSKIIICDRINSGTSAFT